MRTRCPECGTIFRVTSEQLRLKAGKVRCGHCQSVFNAFDHLQPESIDSPSVEESGEIAGLPSGLAGDKQPVVSFTEPEPEPEPVAPVADDPVSESVADTTAAARDAGLVAARDLAETPAYNRWAAGTLAGNGLGSFEPERRAALVWPFVAVALLLLIGLIGQAVFFYRGELSTRLPVVASWFEQAGVEVPLPRHADRVAIESSDLQSDNARGLFVLQATLQNRADYRQAWPALELTMTDTHDTVVTRKVLLPADYLPPGSPVDAFQANAELSVRLWIEAKEIGAAGYRLFVFYP